MLKMVAVYAIIGWIKHRYLKKYTSKPRTRRIVFGFLVFSFAYNVFVYYTHDKLPSLDSLWIRLFKSDQSWHAGNVE